MRGISLIVLATAMQMQPVLACSFDDLRRVADERLEHLISLPAQKFPDDPAPESEAGLDTWQVFEGEKGTPHSLLIKSFDSAGFYTVRVSFVSRHDFVILSFYAVNGERLDDQFSQGKKYLFQGPDAQFFCNDKPQAPPKGALAPLGTEFGDNERWKGTIFNTKELKPYIERIPE